MSDLKYKNFLLFNLIFLSFLSFAQDIRFEKLNMNTGLSHNSALCMSEDHDGFIWIGTRDGLNRFDGKNNIIYKHIFDDTTSISNNQINCLFETGNNEFWIGTANGLCTYIPDFDNFSTFVLSNSDGDQNTGYIWTIEETTDNKLWVGTTQGLFIINPDRKSYITFDSSN